MQVAAMTGEESDELKNASSSARPRSKKKSTLTKLKEKKQKELGSVSSLKKGNEDLLASGAVNYTVDKPVTIIGGHSHGDTNGEIRVSTKDHLIDVGSFSRPNPKPQGRRQSVDVDVDNIHNSTLLVSMEDEGGGNRMRDVADITTVKMFKNLNVDSGQLESVGPSVGHSNFVPRPPSTPRSQRSTPRTPRGFVPAGKGEKRIREPGSSGDEPEVEEKKEKTNRLNDVIKTMETEVVKESNRSSDMIQNLDTAIASRRQASYSQESSELTHKARLRRRSSNAKIDHFGSCEAKNNDIGKPPVKHTPVHTLNNGNNTSSNNGQTVSNTSTVSVDELIIQETTHNTPHAAVSSPRDSYVNRNVEEKFVVSVLDSAPSVGVSNTVPSAPHASTAASASTQDKTDDALMKLNGLFLTDSNPGALLSQPVKTFESPEKISSISSPPRLPRLDPISPRAYPPPLPEELSSKTLRTMYKIDPEVHLRTTSRHLATVVDKTDSAANSNEDHVSQKSFTSVSVLPLITIKEARSRNNFDGSITSSPLGTYELERYFPEKKVNVFVGTWNMNEVKDVELSINDFILPEKCDYVQDIYAIGTQENNMNKKEWEIRIQETIGSSHVMFHSVTLGSLHLAIYIRRDLIWFCSVPEDDAISLRAVTMVKTKGAIGICFTLFGTSFLFINCHLTSDRDNETSRKKNRLGDYCKVISEMKLPKSVENSSTSGKSADVTSVFDCIFWFGDLNFRIERKRQAVERKVNQITSEEFPNFETLLGGDQLLNYMAEGKIFGGFQEGRINFHPTFKFDINSDTYDSSAKNRVPSYTDRIMFRSKKKHDITCLHYDSVMSIKVSDHRPVFGQFEAVIRPGRDNMIYSVGHFDRAVYTEAIRRRTAATQPTKKKQSVVCTIQ